MNKYNKSYIYKIYSPSKDIQYIGSTIQTLSRRLSRHKSDYKRYKNGKKNYTSSFKLLDCPDYRIVLIEECKCENKMELRKKRN